MKNVDKVIVIIFSHKNSFTYYISFFIISMVIS